MTAFAWQLPDLVHDRRHWTLRLTERGAGRLVRSFLAPPDRGLAEVTAVVATEPELAWWIFCRSNAWREHPPRTWEEPARWLLEQAIPLRQFQVRPLPAPATTNRESGQESTGTNLFAILSGSGVEASAEYLRDCPWLPRWHVCPRIAGQREEELSPHAASDGAGFSPLLPDLLERLQRCADLEQRFAETLQVEKLAALRELAYGASHEINNPLANIATRAEGLLRDEPHPERRRKLAMIAAQAYRAHEMISDLMLFAKPPVPVREQVDLAELVPRVVQEFREQAAGQDTELRWESALPTALAWVDATQVSVAVQALIRNALEALGQGGTIAVGLGLTAWDPAAAAGYEIWVRDSGPGLSPRAQRHLFDPFFSGREAGRGLGFGLSKCWRIAELHGGSITVASEPGFGAWFRLQLPSASEPTGAADAGRSPPPAACG